jgi:hypothetical protein
MANAIGNNGGRFYSFASQPVLIDCNFVVDSTNGNGLGIRSLKGQGIKNVFMYTSATPGIGVGGITNPMGHTASEGYAWIQLKSNYNRYLGGFSGLVVPPTGSPLNINSSSAALTVGAPYFIASVGLGPAGQATIAPVADVSGSLASKYFMLYDSYGNSFCIWFSVSGVGSPPNLGPGLSPVQIAAGQRGLQYVQQSILQNATAAQIGAALVLTIENLSSGIVGTFAFTASGTTTVTVVSTITQPLAGIPQDGSTAIPSQGPAIPIIFTLSSAGSASANSVWTDGNGHLYTVTSTLSSGTTLYTSGVGTPGNNGVGTLTYVSGSGATSPLSFSSAVAGLATGFAFALTVSDTNLGDWQAVGLPKGLTPTVGQSFIALATGAGASTGTVYAPGESNVLGVEVVGDPNQSIAPMPQGGSPHDGGWILVKLQGLPSSGQSPIATQPANNSVIGMSFYVDLKFSPSNIGL